jgi:hypothetical protein
VYQRITLPPDNACGFHFVNVFTALQSFFGHSPSDRRRIAAVYARLAAPRALGPASDVETPLAQDRTKDVVEAETLPWATDTLTEEELTLMRDDLPAMSASKARVRVQKGGLKLEQELIFQPFTNLASIENCTYKEARVDLHESFRVSVKPTVKSKGSKGSKVGHAREIACTKGMQVSYEADGRLTPDTSSWLSLVTAT